MNDNSMFWQTTQDMGTSPADDGSSPPVDSGGGVLVTIDHVLGSIPGILDAWRRPVTIQQTRGSTTVTPSQYTSAQGTGTLLMVALIAGLIWVVS